MNDFVFYYIDGYNFIFAVTDTKLSLARQRTNVVSFIQRQFSHLRLRGMIVFDGSHRSDEESGLSYANPLKIAYAPKGQTADEYILEQLQWHKKKGPTIVVSNDKGLQRHAKALKANTQSNEAFVCYLEKKAAKKPKAAYELKDTPNNINRLLYIFEQKLNDQTKEDVD